MFLSLLLQGSTVFLRWDQADDGKHQAERMEGGGKGTL